MFVAFVRNPCTRIHIPVYVYTSVCLVFISKKEPATDEISSPRTRKILVTYEYYPPRIKMMPQYMATTRKGYGYQISIFLSRPTKA